MISPLYIYKHLNSPKVSPSPVAESLYPQGSWHSQPDTEIVPHNSVYPRRPIIKVIISQHNENGILSLLSSHKHSITTEEL